ncbi:MAG: PAS domain S-box protein [Deltaproteobacteria bacterium]|nr:PAS domain S-box protein [Deltaproteobacteria bacterium]
MKSFGSKENYSSRLKFLLAVILLTVLPIGWAIAGTLTLSPEKEMENICHQFDFLIDESNLLTIDEISSKEFSVKFNPIEDGETNFGLTGAAFWLRFQISNPLSEHQKRFLEFAYPLLDKIELYSPAESNQFSLKKAGRLEPFKNREVKHRNSIFTLDSDPGSLKTYYVRVQTQEAMMLEAHLHTAGNMIKNDHFDQLLFGILFGIIFFAGLYHLIIGLRSRYKGYLYYSLFLFIFGAYGLIDYGLAYELLWPDWPLWGKRAHILFIGLSELTILLFGYSFLSLSSSFPRISRIYRIFFVLTLLSAFASLIPVLDYTVIFIFQLMMGLIFLPLSLVMGLLAWRKGYLPAKYYFYSWVVFLMGAFVIMCLPLGLFPVNSFTQYAYMVGVILSVVLFSYGFSERINLLQEHLSKQTTELEENQTELLHEIDLRKKADNELKILNDDLERQVFEQTRELSEKQKNLLKAQEIAKLGHFHFNPSTDLLKGSDELFSIYGLNKDDFDLQSFVGKIHPDDNEFAVKTFQDSLASRKSCQIEYRLLMKDQSIKYVFTNVHPTFDKDENGWVLMGTVQDITERKRMEAETEQLGLILENSLNEIYIFDERELKFIYANKGAVKNTQYSLEELKGMTPLDIKTSFTAADFAELLEPLRKQETEIIRFENIHQRKDGSTYPAEVSLQLYPYGETKAFVALINDISERYALEEEIKLNQQHLENAQRIAKLGSWMVDFTTGKSFWSKEMYRVFEVESKDRVLDYQYFLDHIHPDDNEMVMERIERINRDHLPYDTDHRIITELGNSKNIHCRIIQVFDPKGIPLSIEGTVRDITDQKRIESEIIEAKKKAEEASKTKTAFLANMSHELRTPLNAVIGFSQLLILNDGDSLNEDQKQQIQMIHGSGKLLLQLIEDLLDLSVIESGSIEVPLETVDLFEIATETVSILQPLKLRFGFKNLRQKIKKGVYVKANALRLKQVLINLLSNAIKYSHSDDLVELFQETSGDSVKIIVSDTGPGVSPEKIEKLFEPFERLGKEASNIEGTGIGLVLTKKLVELMQGGIEFENKPGEGLAFTLTFPLVKIKSGNQADGVKKLAPEKKQSKFGLKRVLYVDDRRDNLDLVKNILFKRQNISLYLARDAQTGIDLTKELAFDLILMDIAMPGMDGFEALEIIKRDEKTRMIPVLALSAKVFKKDLLKASEAGFADFIKKPINVDVFLETIDHYLEDQK